VYSAVILLAMSGAAEVPETFFGGGCFGCGGGCFGGWGGCYGGWGGGCYGGWGGCYGGGCYGRWGGCYGGHAYGCGGGYYYGCQGYAPIHHRNGKHKKTNGDEGTEGEEARKVRMPARVVVHLPADANLDVDGYKVRSKGAVRPLLTPRLEKGKTYVLNMKAQMTSEGKPVTVTRRVEVRAGQQTEVKIALPRHSVAKK
jgi:uncharacterized protein (TIGR03000 family)